MLSKKKMDSNQEKAAKQEELLLVNQATQARMEAKMDSSQEKAEASIAKLEETMEETIKHQMQHFLLSVDESMQNLPGTTEIDPDPRMMPSAEEHHEILNRKAAVTPVR
jgi:hypothetical protein